VELGGFVSVLDGFMVYCDVFVIGHVCSLMGIFEKFAT
jgi:hypothetical protein